jgi:hypothetical protein
MSHLPLAGYGSPASGSDMRTDSDAESDRPSDSAAAAAADRDSSHDHDQDAYGEMDVDIEDHASAALLTTSADAGPSRAFVQEAVSRYLVSSRNSMLTGWWWCKVKG